MNARPGATMTPTATPTEPAADPRPVTDVSRLHQEGFLAGLVGAATVALWFLLVDALNGRPLYTPTVLGTALFRHGAGLGSPETLPISFEMVWMFTWVHGLVFAAIGGLAARLLALAERNPSFGFGILLLFVVFEFGFVLTSQVIAESVLDALAWPAVLTGNLLAAAAMAAVLWRRHPRLDILP